MTKNSHLVLASCCHFLEPKILIAIHKLTIKIKRKKTNQPTQDKWGKKTWQAVINPIIAPSHNK